MRRLKTAPAGVPAAHATAGLAESGDAAGVQPGALYVVATPLGNRRDITLRALDVLGAVDLIAAEDTRHTRPLLAHYGIATPLTPYHAHNEAAQAPRLVARLVAGAALALVSDAGTPLLSDPGAALVHAARAAGRPVYAVPGPCAAVAALSVAGMEVSAFVFEGFLPARAPARRVALERLADEARTAVLYEAPHRIAALLADVAAVLGAQRRLALVKEITKVHEGVAHGTAGELAAWLEEVPQRARGEFVVLIEGAAARPQPAGELDAVLARLLPVLGPRAAAAAAAALTGAARNRAYRRAHALAGACTPPQEPAD